MEVQLLREDGSDHHRKNCRIPDELTATCQKEQNTRKTTERQDAKPPVRPQSGILSIMIACTGW